MAYTVRREELAALRDEWLQLLQRQDEPIPFVHPTWLRVWLDEFQGERELLLYAVRDGETLAGVAPLLRSDGHLQFVGHYSICDYMDFVIAPEHPREVLGAVLETLLGEAWSEIELRGLREDSTTWAEFPALAEAAGLAVDRQEEAVAPRVSPAASWEEYLASLSKKNRHELRRKLRRLQTRGELELRTHTAREAVAEHLPTLLRFMVDSRSDKASFMSEQMGRFFHRMTPAMADEGLVRLYELELDTKAVASILCFDLGGRLFMYNSGYDPEYAELAVGLASKTFCLEDAIEHHCRGVDFLRGHEAYKYDLGGIDRMVYRCLITRT